MYSIQSKVYILYILYILYTLYFIYNTIHKYYTPYTSTCCIVEGMCHVTGPAAPVVVTIVATACASNSLMPTLFIFGFNGYTSRLQVEEVRIASYKDVGECRAYL